MSGSGEYRADRTERLLPPYTSPDDSSIGTFLERLPEALRPQHRE